MKNLIYYLGLLLFVVISFSSCGKKMVPSEVIGKSGKSFDPAAFNYFYVEGIKQKLMGDENEALKRFDQCIRINPENDASYYQIAQIMTGNGDLKSGKENVLKAISLDSKNVWYLVMMAGIYYQENNLDSAIYYYENAVSLFPEKEDLMLMLANLYSENRSFKKANSIFEYLDEKYGVNEKSTVSSIKNLIIQNDYDEALIKIKSLIKQKPDDIMYNGLMAEIYRGKGEGDKALEVYRMLIERNPDDPQTQLSLCGFLIKEKSYDELFSLLNTVIINTNISRNEKVTLFAELIEIPEVIEKHGRNLLLAIMVLEANYKNDDVIPLLRPEVYVKQNKLSEAASLLESIIKTKPESYYAWEKLLLVYLQAEDYGKLFNKGKECATLFNMSFLAKILYANGAIELKKYPIALEELRKAEIIAGDNKDFLNQVLTMRADVYYRMNEYDKAFKIFEELLSADKENIVVINNYAYYLAEQNMKLKEAEKMAKKVIEKEGNNNTYLDTYAWVLYKRGKLKEAAKVMESIILNEEKPNAEYYEHYGYILKKQKKCDKAVKYWEIAVKLDESKVNLIKEIENCIK